MGHRDGGEALVAGITEALEGPFGELAGGWPRQLAMQGVEFGQRLAVGHGVAAGEWPRGRAAAVAQMVRGGELPDQALHLRRGVTADLDQKAQQKAALATVALGVAELAQHLADPAAPGGPIGGVEVDLQGAGKEALDLLEAGQVLGVQGHDHPQRMT